MCDKISYSCIFWPYILNLHITAFIYYITQWVAAMHHVCQQSSVWNIRWHTGLGWGECVKDSVQTSQNYCNKGDSKPQYSVGRLCFHKNWPSQSQHPWKSCNCWNFNHKTNMLKYTKDGVSIIKPGQLESQDELQHLPWQTQTPEYYQTTEDSFGENSKKSLLRYWIQY